MAKGSIWKTIKTIGFKFAAFFLSLFIAFLILPVITILFTPIYLFRFIVSKLSKYVRPDLGKILSTRSTNFSSDKLHEPNPACIIVVVNVLEGTISLDSLHKAYVERIFNLQLPNGELRYPELKQYPTDWMGFKFWKHDDKFDVKNHVTFYESGETVTETVLQKLRQDALVKPFPKNRSPWDMLLVNNYYPSYNTSVAHSLFFMRIHHSLADGYSLMKLLIEGVFGQAIPKNARPAGFKRKSCMERFRFNSLFPFRAVFELSEKIIRLAIVASSPWHVPVKNRTYSVHALTNRISIDSLKKFKAHMNVSFSSVVFAACAAGIKATMMKKGLDIPEDISCILPFPIPGHPDKLRNHVTQVFIDLPLSSVTNSEDRIKLLHESYSSLSTSTTPFFNAIFSKAVGGLFTRLTNVILTGVVPSVLISNFPANFNSLVFEGHRNIDTYFFCGLINLPAISFFIASFNEAIRVAVVSERSLMSSEEVQVLVNHIENELIACINQAAV